MRTLLQARNAALDYLQTLLANIHGEGSNVFSVRQKREISAAVQKILRNTDHPELPEYGEITFHLRVEGSQPWSYADIKNNSAVAVPDVNPWNEAQDKKNSV